MIVVLAGGVGAARFLQGVVQVVPPEEIIIIANTGDDREFYGLHVSPDVDIVMYTLAGIVDEQQGWGIRNDTSNTMQRLIDLGHEDWFKLGDQDLATHIHRTMLLHQGQPLSTITEGLRQRMGIKPRIIPMSDNSVATHIQTPTGLIHFEEYFAKNHFKDEVLGVEFIGAHDAKPAPGVIDAIKQADAILVAPSNPIVSIGTILSIPGIHDALHETSGMVVAVSPLVGGAPIKGPADKLMRALHMEASAVGVTRHYRDFLDVMVIDQQDAHLAGQVEDLGIPCVVTDTIMRDLDHKTALARTVIQAAGLTY